MKNLESAYKKLPVKMNAFFINEYVHVKYIKIKEGLNCFLSLRKLTIVSNYFDRRQIMSFDVNFSRRSRLFKVNLI